MKKTALFIFTLLLSLGFTKALAQTPRLGLCVYNGQDTFIQSLFTYIEELAQGRAEVFVRDAANDQNKQNDQIQALLDLGVDALVVNPVDRISAVYLIGMAQKAGTPIVLVNREPLQSDLDLYDLAYYVGIDPKEQGELSGETAADYFLNHPDADKNNDGVMQVVLLKGEPGHQDAENRTDAALKAIRTKGVKVEVVAQDTAMWERSLGQEKMAGFLNSLGDSIECVLCNNDDMALGAIDALKAAGYFTLGRSMPVLGIDFTAPAKEALKAQTLYGTVVNDAKEQGRAAFELSLLLSKGEKPNEENFPYTVNGKVVYLDSRVITLETLALEE